MADEKQAVDPVEDKPFKPSSPSSKLNFDGFWEYDNAPQSTEHVEIKEQYNLFIGGEFVTPEKERYFDSVNPATEKTLTSFAEATQQDVDKAVSAARKAYDKTWSKLEARERGKFVFRLARLIQERAREIAVLESLDGGKPIRESRDVDVPSRTLFLLCGMG